MRGRWWHSTPVLFVLLVSVALAQKDNSTHDSAKPATSDHSQPAANQQGDTTVALTNTQPDKPTAQSAGGSAAAKDAAQTSPTFVEDFPAPPDEDVEIPKPRIPLPVILDSDSPHMDRQVRREDIQDLPDDYVLGEEDMLTVTIWKEREASGAMVVRPDGKITVPLIGEVKVVGMKPAQLQTLLEEKLKPYITVPKVSVAVNQINSRKIYLIGQVVREGTFPINSSMTVLQVLAAAGGLRDFAKRKKIYVLRKHGDEEIRFPFDYDAAIRGRNREENIRVEPGDTIVVP